MLTIRLSRIGKRKKPMYRLIISEKARDPYGRALEILGSYNPFSKELIVKKERIEHWLSNGAQMSPTVNNLLLEKEIIKGEKVVASKAQKKKKGGDEESKESASATPTAPKAEEKKEPKEEPAKTEDPKTEGSSTNSEQEKKEPTSAEAADNKKPKTEEKAKK